MATIQLTLDARDKGWQEVVNPDRLRELLSDRANLLWLDISDPGPAELELLRREFSFHELALEDVAKRHHRPKYDTFRGYFFTVVYAAEHTAEEFVPRELQLFCGENYLVTIHDGPLAALDEARKRWARHEARQEIGIGYLVYALFDSLVDGYLELQDWVGERMETIEKAALAGIPGAASALYMVHKQLLRIGKVLRPTDDILAEVIRRGQPQFPESLRPYFADVHDHAVHVLGELDSYRSLSTAAIDVHSQSMFARLGVVVQRLTAITVIIMVPNLVASVYGMNFDKLFPPGDWEYGFVAIVALLACMVAWGFIHSRILKWL
jgi:magnesium transporter